MFVCVIRSLGNPHTSIIHMTMAPGDMILSSAIDQPLHTTVIAVYKYVLLKQFMHNLQLHRKLSGENTWLGQEYRIVVF